ncbi:MAG: hypothetical protein AAF682_10985 [Planctomycetota bacterium]
MNGVTYLDQVELPNAHASWFASPWEASWVGAVGLDPAADEDATLTSHYRVEVDVPTEGEWIISLNSNFWGTLINLGPQADTSFGQIDATLVSPHTLVGGSLDVPISASLASAGDLPVSGSSNAVIRGEDPSVVVVEYTFNASASTESALFLPPSECVARFGQHPVGFSLYDSTSYASDDMQAECHNVKASYELAVVQQPQGAAICQGESHAISVEAAGHGPFTYMWLGGAEGEPFHIILSTETTSSTTSTYVATEPGWYHCAVGNATGVVPSEFVQVTVGGGFPLAQPEDQSYCAGGSLTLSTPQVAGVSHSWSNGSETYYGDEVTISSAQPAVQTWRLTGVDACASKTSDPFTVTVTGVPKVSITGSALFGCIGGVPASLDAKVDGGAPEYDYKWFINGDEQAGSTDSTLDLGLLEPADSGMYRVVVTDNNGCTGEAETTVFYQDFGLPFDAYWHDVPSGATQIDEFFLTAPSEALSSNWFSSSIGFATVSCPPTGTAFVADTAADTKPDVEFRSGEMWTLEGIEVSGGGGVAQAVVLAEGAELTATSEAKAKAGGVLRLLEGTLAGDVTAEEGGLVEGVGRINGDVKIEAGGSLVTPDTGLLLSGATQDLVVAGNLDVLGDVVLQGSQTAQLDVVPPAVGLSAELSNSGLLDLGADSVLRASSIQNYGGQLGSGTVLLEKGIELACATIEVLGEGDLVNHMGARIHGSGTIDAPIYNDGVIRALGSGIEVTGAIHNDGYIVIDTEMSNGGLTGGGFVWGAFCDASPTCTGVGCCSMGFACTPSGQPVTDPLLNVFGDVLLDPQAELRFDSGVIEVEGDFRSAIVDPFGLDLIDATLRMDGFFFDGGQELEVAATDLGPPGAFDAAAFFPIGMLEIGPTPAEVTLVQPSGTSPHALYVERLVVDNLAVLRLGDVKVYVGELEIQAGGHLALDQGTVFYETLIPADACAQGLVGGDCSQLVPMPAPDCNGNGLDDALDIAAGTSTDCNGNGVPDSCDIQLGASFDQDLDGIPDDCQSFFVDIPAISATAGGVQVLTLQAGAEQGSGIYFVSGSMTGTAPGLPLGGVIVPLVFDGYSLATISGANSVPFVNTNAELDDAGAGRAQIELPPGFVSVSGAGLTLYHAFVVVSPSGGIAFASNATSLTVEP